MPENNRKIPWYPIIWFLTTLVIGAVAFTTVKLTAGASAKKIDRVAPTVAEHETKIAVLQTAQTFIKDTVKDVKEEQKIQRRILERIDRKIP
jgi:outer membrane murein-binding lipoprotein Lpp